MKSIKLLFLTLFIVIIPLSLPAQWQQLTLPIGFVSAIVEKGNVIYVAAGGGVHKSTNDGATWTSSYNIPSSAGSIEALLVVGQNIYAGTYYRGIYRSIDDGVTWQQTNTGLSDTTVNSLIYFNNTFFAGVGTGNVVNQSGMFKSPDGVTWSAVNLNIASNMQSTFCLTNVGGMLFCGLRASVGTISKTLRSVDGGLNWTIMPNYNLGYPGQLKGINSWLFGVWGNNGLRRSDDGGLTTINISGGIPGFDDFGSHVLEGANGEVFASVQSGGVYHSTNNGQNWTTINGGLTSLNTITDLFATDRFLFLATNSATLWKLTLANTYTINISRSNINKSILDNQNTFDTLWISPNSPGSISVRDVNVTIDTIIHPNDGDLEISLLHLGITDTVVYRVGGSGGNFIGTVLNDSAATSISNGSGPFTGSFIPSKPLAQFNTLDASGSWILRVFDRTTGNTGTLKAWGLSITTSMNPISVHSISSEIPKKFLLLQNYPNPFNPSTNIHFAVPKSSSVKIAIYDMLGRELETIVNEKLDAGTYNANWNALKYSSGVYFYKLTAGDFTEFKKMILLK
jgi:subtilisin-like proprotein convertase family protein